MPSRWAVRTGVRAGWMLVAVVAATAANAASDARILQFDRLRAVTSDRDSVLRKSASQRLRELRFDAFGRRFEMSLDPNSPLLDQLDQKTSPTKLQLYRGRLNDVAGSWARLAANGDAVQGMFWDGVDLYVIEPAAQVRESVANAQNLDPTETVIFRLHDVLIDANAAVCAVDDQGDGAKASKQFEALIGELKGAPGLMQAAGAYLRLQLSAMGDASFLRRYASEAEARDAILVRLNNVDGIFSSQLGVEIHVPTLFVNDAQSDPLSDSTSANALLQELASLRKRSPKLNSTGLTHLFTGRDLSGETVGIAYLNRVCHMEYGVGLTEVRSTAAWRDSLIAAHEIGHNFGANHDGDAQGACPTTPTGAYLMSSSVSGNDRFSQCSLDSMRPRALAAACIAALPEADLTVASDLGVKHGSVAKSVDWRLDVTNVGGVVAQRVRAEVLVPPVVNIEDAYVIGGSCTSGAGVILCELGDVPGGATRAVNLTLRSDAIGTSSISVRIASDNDAVLTNNRGDGELDVQPEADIAVALDGPAVGTVGDELRLTFELANVGASSASNVRLTVELPEGVAASQAALNDAACSITGARIECFAASLPGEGAANGAITLAPSASGALTVRASATGSYFDPQPANDSAQHVISVQGVGSATPQTAPATNGGRSGGGASSLLLLFALAGLRFLRR